MNTNLLLIAGAAVAYALLRPKATSATTTSSAAAASPTTGANTYVPVIPRTTSPVTGGGLLTNAGTIISQGTTLVTAGATAWDSIKDALHIGAHTPPANNSGSVWAGPNYNYQEA